MTTMPLTLNDLPKILILPTDDLIELYIQQTNHFIQGHDLQEVITQIIQMLLNEENGDLECLSVLPEFNRMIRTDYLTDPNIVLKIQQETEKIGLAIAERLTRLGAYVDGGFPYFFDRFIGTDIVLNRLPY